MLDVSWGSLILGFDLGIFGPRGGPLGANTGQVGPNQSLVPKSTPVLRESTSWYGERSNQYQDKPLLTLGAKWKLFIRNVTRIIQHLILWLGLHGCLLNLHGPGLWVLRNGFLSDATRMVILWCAGISSEPLEQVS